jgi:phosphatidylinositol alpha-1,6-mannosyltransferase
MKMAANDAAKRRKVLFVSPYFPPITGGSCVVYGELCARLADEVVVLTSVGDPRTDAAFDAAQTYPIHRSTALNVLGAPTRSDRLTRLLRALYIFGWQRGLAAVRLLYLAVRSRATVVCIGALGHYWVAGLMRRCLGLPVVFYTHGEELTNPDPSRFVGQKPYDALRAADAVVAVSTFTSSVLTRLGVPPERIALIPNGVDLDRFTPGPKDAAIVDRHGLAGRRVLLTVSRPEKRKGHANVIRALPRLVAKYPDLVYVIVESGDGLPSLGLDTLAADLGVSAHVVFAGKVPADELCAYHRTCDVFIMPNYTLENGDTEGFGLVFLEANACAKPVVGGRAGGVPDAIVDNVTGLLVDGTSVDAVAGAVERLLDAPEFARELGGNGRRRAEAMSWDVAHRRFVDVCDRHTTQARGASPVGAG